MKYNQLKYCAFHKCDTPHYSSECSRNPDNMRNSRMTEKDKNIIKMLQEPNNKT